MSRKRVAVTLAICGCAATVLADETRWPLLPAFCVSHVTMSCAGLHADTSQVCFQGNNAWPCPDLIVQDAQVNVLTIDTEGKVGYNRDPDVTTLIYKRFCSGATCMFRAGPPANNPESLNCSGESERGNDCDISGPPV